MEKKRSRIIVITLNDECKEKPEICVQATKGSTIGECLMAESMIDFGKAEPEDVFFVLDIIANAVQMLDQNCMEHNSAYREAKEKVSTDGLTDEEKEAFRMAMKMMEDSSTDKQE